MKFETVSKLTRDPPPKYLLIFLQKALASDNSTPALKDIQVEVLSQSWQGLSYQQIADAVGYDHDYIKQVGSQLWRILSDLTQTKVTKLNLRTQLQQYYQKHILDFDNPSEHPQNPRIIDWGMTLDIPHFYGRDREIAQVKQWIIAEQCRLISVLGMGGIGKSALAFCLGQSIQGTFEVVIWRSLKSSPPLEQELDALLQRMISEDTHPAKTIEAKLEQLIHILRQRRCLLILDNFDILLENQKKCGSFQKNYQNYKELLQYIAGVAHQSCLIITSREKPQGLDIFEGQDFPVRSLYLDGLDIRASRLITNNKGLNISDQELNYLVNYYRGNPMALKIISTAILEIFAGDVSQFLQQASGVFSSISTILSEQLQRLSKLEKAILYWLAINYVPISLAQLQKDLVHQLEAGTLLEVIESLKQRSLIETTRLEASVTLAYTLQPVVMEFVLQNYVQTLFLEITSQAPQLLQEYALLKIDVTEGVRQAQKRLILEPLIQKLLHEYSTRDVLVVVLNHIIQSLRQDISNLKGYCAGNILNICWGLDANLTACDYSQLYIRQAILDQIILHETDFSASTFQDCLFAHTFGGITHIDFSPNGEMFATCDSSGSVSVWSVETMQPLVHCRGHDFWIWSVAFHPTEPILASCGDDRKIYLWDVTTGHCLKVFKGHTSVLLDVTFSPDGSHVVSCSNDATLRYWDFNTGDCIQTLESEGKSVWSVAFTADSRHLYSAGEDNCIRFWDLNTGTCQQVIVAHSHWVVSIALSPDERFLASASVDGSIKLWDTKTLTCLKTLTDHQAPVMSVAFSPDGQFIASGSYDQTVRLYSMATGTCTKVLRQHTNRVWAVSFHPHGTLLSSGGDDNSTRFWHLPSGELQHVLKGYSNAIYDIAANHNGSLIASAHEDETIRLWCCEDQQPRATPPSYISISGHQNRVFSLELSPDETKLASASLDRSIKLWDIQSQDCIMTLQGHSSWIWDLSFHPHSNLLASASYDKTIKLWDLEQGQCQQTLIGHERSAHCVVFSPTGALLASGGYDERINLWNPESGELISFWRAHQNRIWDIAFSPDGQYLASAGEDHLIMLWDVYTGQRSQVLAGHGGNVLSVAFSNDGEQLFSTSSDQTIKQWDLKTGKCLKTFKGHQGWVWSVACLPDQIITCSQDEMIYRWSLLDSSLDQTLNVPRPYKNMNITGVKGLTHAQYQALKVLGAVEHED